MSASIPYNCFAHALGVIDSQRVIDLLIADGYRESSVGVKCGTEFVEILIQKALLLLNDAGPIIVYFRDSRPVHAGLVSGDMVISKWGGEGLLWKHGTWEVPSSYGQEIRRYDRVFVEAIEQEFERYAVDL